MRKVLSIGYDYGYYDDIDLFISFTKEIDPTLEQASLIKVQLDRIDEKNKKAAEARSKKELAKKQLVEFKKLGELEQQRKKINLIKDQLLLANAGDRVVWKLSPSQELYGKIAEIGVQITNTHNNYIMTVRWEATKSIPEFTVTYNGAEQMTHLTFIDGKEDE